MGDGGFFAKANRDGLRQVAVGNGFDIGVDMAIEHIDYAGGIRSECRVVGDHNDGVAFGMNVFEFFHDDVGRARIEVAGGFVGENNFRVRDDSASNGNALLLASRKLPGKIIFTFLKVETAESAGGLGQAMGFGIAGIDQGESDVFEY